MKKVVLAYSGGLDTSVILKWLMDQGYEVIAYIADVGQKEDFEAAREKALKIGASSVYIEDLKKEFVEDYIYPAIKGGAIYEGRYFLGTSLARPIIAKRQIEIAKEVGAVAVSHGATGKGNDQLRFELSYYALYPEVEVIAPWKDPKFLAQFEGRNDLLDYASANNIEVEVSKKSPFSMDANLMHISYEAGILEDPKQSPPADMFKMTVSPQEAPNATQFLRIIFEGGLPKKVINSSDSQEVMGSVEIVDYLNTLGGKNGVGRIDIVENRYIGIKSRGVYETPGVTILYNAYRDLEVVAIDKEVWRLLHRQSITFADAIYNGYWFTPEMNVMLSTVDAASKDVSGYVDLEIYKGNITVTGRGADNSLYDEDLASMDIAGGYDQADADGFIKVNALRLKKAGLQI